MKQSARVRVFSIKRLILSLILGFVIPVSYTFMLVQFGPGRVRASQFEILVTPIRWPLSLWMFLTQHEPVGREIIAAVVLMAVCNTVFYGLIVYAALLAISLVRRKPGTLEPPPMLEPFPMRLVPPDPAALKRGIDFR